ncbi:hypothetical protein, partial [Klebsiella pneumoniae]|uniref:hypothetical protein n=1 Tax=Klebsiella pneumoniae TaxID=573 RepID=UPI00163DDFD3
PYKQGKAERDQLNELLDQLVKAGVLEEVGEYNQYASPVFLVKNKDGSPRLVTDFRRINKILADCVSATPSVGLVLSCLNKANRFSRLDLKGAFLQLSVKKEDRTFLTIKTQD